MFELAESRGVDHGVTMLALVHVALLATYHESQHASWESVLWVVHWLFTAMYAFELTFKLTAVGPRAFVRSWSRLYDSAVVVAMVVTPALGHTLASGVLRAFRLDRTIKLLSRLQGLRSLFDALLNSVIPMANITALFFLVLFVYAVLGMQLFALTRFGEGLDANNSFETFPKALLTLFNIAAGADWVTIMRDCAVEPPYCTAGEDCGSRALAPLYFFSFYALVFFVFLNLYVAAILDTFTAGSRARDHGGAVVDIGEDDLEQFRDVWREFDPRGVGRLPLARLEAFVTQLGLPLGMDAAAPNHRRRFLALREEVAFRCKADTHVGFYELLHSLSVRRVPETALEIEERLTKQREDETVLVQFAVTQIQKNYRGLQERRRLGLTGRASTMAEVLAAARGVGGGGVGGGGGGHEPQAEVELAAVKQPPSPSPAAAAEDDDPTPPRSEASMDAGTGAAPTAGSSPPPLGPPITAQLAQPAQAQAPPDPILLPPIAAAAAPAAAPAATPAPATLADQLAGEATGEATAERG